MALTSSSQTRGELLELLLGLAGLFDLQLGPVARRDLVERARSSIFCPLAHSTLPLSSTRRTAVVLPTSSLRILA